MANTGFLMTWLNYKNVSFSNAVGCLLLKLLFLSPCENSELSTPRLSLKRPSQGGYPFPCSPEINRFVPLFPKIKIFISYVPCSPKLPLFPCSPHFKPLFSSSPEINALVPHDPRKPLGGPHLTLTMYLDFLSAFHESSIPDFHWQAAL